MRFASSAVVLAAAMPAFAGGGSADSARRAQEDFESCLARREQARAPAPAAGPSCAGDCTIDDVLKSADLKSSLFPDVVLRQVCESLVDRSPAACDALADVPGEPETGQRMCRRLYAMSLLSRSLIAGKTEPALCRAWCELAPPPPPPAELIGKVCASLARRDGESACADIERFRASPDRGYNVRECRWEMLSVLGEGDEAECPKHYRPGSDVCLATAQYRKGTCGADPICGALKGLGRAACAPLEASIVRQARGASHAAASGKPAVVSLDQINRECARARAYALVRLEGAPPELRARQKNAEDAYALRSGAEVAHRTAPPSSYAGAWTLRYARKKATGRCRAEPADIGRERVAGTINVDEGGRFLLFAEEVSIAGVIDAAAGSFEALIVDPACGEGLLKGACAPDRGCAGSYARSAGADASGVITGETGEFRLSR